MDAGMLLLLDLIPDNLEIAGSQIEQVYSTLYNQLTPLTHYPLPPSLSISRIMVLVGPGVPCEL